MQRGSWKISRFRRWDWDSTRTGIGIWSPEFSVAGFLLVLVVVGAKTLGELQLEWTAPHTDPGRMVLTLGILIVAAAFEELIFRGYPMQVLMKGMGPWPAMLIMSSLFGLLHAKNPNSSVLGVFNTIVAGMMLSLAYFKTRSLWFPYGLHLAWNVGTGMVVGFPLSGTGFASTWTAHVNGAFVVAGSRVRTGRRHTGNNDLSRWHSGRLEIPDQRNSL